MIKVDGFTGVDKKNENVRGLLPNALNADFGNPIGRAKKRDGLYKLFNSIGTGKINGQFTYKHPDGDIPLFAHGTKLYKLTGTAGTIQSNFTTGTHINTIVEANVLKNELEVEEVSQTQQNGSMDIFKKGIKQTFSISRRYITAISLYVAGYDSGATLSVKVGNTTKTVSLSATGWLKIVFDNPVLASNVFEISSNKSVTVYTNSLNPYIYGEMYIVNTKQPTTDLAFKIHTHSGLTASWISQSYDLYNTPIQNKITYTKTTPSGTSVKFYSRGSNDNEKWGEWQETIEELPFTRFIQIKIEGNSGNFINQWSVSEFKISYTSGYTKPTEITSGLSGNRVVFDEWRGRCYFCDGTKNHVYDGTKVRTLGLELPSAAPTVAASGTGDFTGKYRFKVTFVNEDGNESNPSPASSEVTASSNKQFDLTAIPVKTGYKRRIYRTKKDIGVYYYVAEIDDEATAYTDTKADDLLTLEMIEDNFIPKAGNIICFHKNYMFIVPAEDETKLRYCKVINPDASPTTFYKQLPGKINSVKSYSDQLIVSGELFTVAYSGSIFHTTLDNTIQREISNVGALSHEGVVECLMANVGVVLVMPTREGYKYLTPGLHEFSLLQRPFSYEVNEYFERCIKAGLAGNIVAIEHENILYIALTYYEESQLKVTKNNYILPYNLLTKKWYDLWSIPASGFQKIEGMLFCGDPENGIIYEMLKGSDDAGTDIHFIIDVPVNAGDRVKFRKMRLVVGNDSVTDTLFIKHQVDTSSKTTQTQPGPVSEWNADITGHYGMVTMKSKIMYPKLKTGNYYIARIEDNSKNPFSIYGIEVEEG